MGRMPPVFLVDQFVIGEGFFPAEIPIVAALLTKFSSKSFGQSFCDDLEEDGVVVILFILEFLCQLLNSMAGDNHER